MDEAELSRVQVRTAVPADIDALGVLNGVVQALHHDEHPELFKAPNPEASKAQLLALLAQPGVTVLLAEVDGGPAGYSCVERVDRPATALTNAHSHVYVHHLAVASDMQGSGVGRALLGAVKTLAWSMGVRDVRLDYWSFNARATAFFDNQGFVPYNVKARMQLQEPQ